MQIIGEVVYIIIFFNIFALPKSEIMSVKHIIALVVVYAVLFSCTKDQMVPASQKDAILKSLVRNAAPNNQLEHWIVPEATDLKNIPQDPKNPLTPEKVALGKFLFYETAFATDASKMEGMGTYSCASCHLPSAGFRPGSAQGIADGGIGYGINGEQRARNTAYAENEMDVQGARPLSLIGVAFVENTMWNGSFGSFNANIGTESRWIGDFANNNLGMSGIEAQNIEGMHTHRFNYNKEAVTKYGYKDIFDQVFADVKEEERYTNETASFALSAYIRTLMPNEAPFQYWLKGNVNALSPEEKEGAMLFFGKAACTNCHQGPAFSSVDFHAIGVNDMYQRPSFNTSSSDLRNLGRGGFTGVQEDLYKFKVPQLYNMSDSDFYFHGSSKRKLKDVIKYFNLAVPENPNVPMEQISDKFKPLNLTDEEVDKLTLFLTKSLRDPALDRYAPSQVLSGLCFPNADSESMIDLGCQ